MSISQSDISQSENLQTAQSDNHLETAQSDNHLETAQSDNHLETALDIEDTTPHIYVQLHGKWYDFEGFNHPGGPVALKLAKDRDATAMFELHHPFTSKNLLNHFLEKHHVSDEEATRRGLKLDETEQLEDFTWEKEDAFRTDMVESMRKYFKELSKEKNLTMREAMKMSVSSWLVLSILLVLTLVTYGFYLTGWWWTLLVMPWLIWVTTGRFLHDGSHFALSTNWKLNQIFTHTAPWAASSSTWYIQHVIGHHAHTNIPNRDPDLYHGPENWRYVPHVEWRTQYKRQHWVWPVIWFGSTISIAFLNELFDTKYYNGVVKIGDRTTNNYQLWFVIRMILLFIIFGAPIIFVGLLKGLIFLLISWIHLSCIFMAFTQVSHLDELCGKVREENFWKHQIATSSDYSVDSLFWNVLSIGLNAQTIHHSFPTINPSHFPYIYPIFKEVCERHGVKYQEKSSFYEALKEYWNVLRLYSQTDEEIAMSNSLIS